MNKKTLSILLIFTVFLFGGCSNSDADMQGGQSSMPSKNVPVQKIDLSYTSHGEGEFKLKATNASDNVIELKNIHLEAYDSTGMPLEVTEIKSSSGELKPGEESGLYKYKITPSGEEKKIVIDDYTYKINGETYNGDIYYEAYETADDGTSWASNHH